MYIPKCHFSLLFVFFIFATVSTLAQSINLLEGTALSLTLTTDISSKEAKRGDPVGFMVEKDVVIDGQVLIKQGTEAKGSIIFAEKSGYLGHSGKLAIQFESTTTVDGQSIPLRGAKGNEGNSASGATQLAGPFGPLVKGGNVILSKGTRFTVYTAEDRRFRIEGNTLTTEKSEVVAPDNISGQMVTVYIYRQNKKSGWALEPSVFCDGIELARMDNGRFFKLKLPPGKHIVHLTSEKKGYEINMGGGETYYFRIGIEMGIWKGKGKIVLESNDKGAEEIKKIKPLGADKVKDKTLVVITPVT